MERCKNKHEFLGQIWLRRVEFAPLFKPIGVLFGSVVDGKSMFSLIEFVHSFFHFFHSFFDIEITGRANNIRCLHGCIENHRSPPFYRKNVVVVE
jgi:hypothetical protein